MQISHSIKAHLKSSTMSPQLNETNTITFEDSQNCHRFCPRFSNWNTLSQHQKLLIVIVLSVIVLILAIVVGIFCCHDNCCRRRGRQVRYRDHDPEVPPVSREESEAELILGLRRPRRARQPYILSRYLHRYRDRPLHTVETLYTRGI